MPEQQSVKKMKMKRKYREKKLIVPRKQNKNIPEDKERKKKVYPKK